MTTTNPTTSTTSTTSTGSTTQGTGANAMQSLAGNFDTFLQLLTTQLQNQDPTRPLDTNQFTRSWCSSPGSNSRST